MRPVGRTSFGRAVAAVTSSPIGIGNGRFHYATEACDVETVYLGTFDRRTIVAAGGYDEAGIQWAAEDQELAFRVRQQGGRIRLDPSIRSWYTPRETPRPSGSSTATTGSARPRRCASTAACPICARSLRPQWLRGPRVWLRSASLPAGPWSRRLPFWRTPRGLPPPDSTSDGTPAWRRTAPRRPWLSATGATASVSSPACSGSSLVALSTDAPKAVDVPLPDRNRLDEYAAKGLNLGLRTLAIAPEQREARALAATGTAAGDGPRVLILSPRGWSYHLQVEGVLGQALAERGAEVHVLTCGGGLPICDRTNTWQAPPMPCTSCTRYTTASVTAHGHHHHQLRLAWEDDPGDGLPEVDEIGLADLERFEKGDLPLGALTAIPVRWFLMNSHLDDDPLAPATVRSFLRAADRVGRGVAETLDNVRPDVVLLLNGLFFFEAITWELCRRQGIDVVTYERGFLPHTLEFRRDLPACRHDMGALWEDVADRPLDEGQEDRLDDYLDGRRDRPHPVYDFWQGPTMRRLIVGRVPS